MSFMFALFIKPYSHFFSVRIVNQNLNHTNNNYKFIKNVWSMSGWTVLDLHYELFIKLLTYCKLRPCVFVKFIS